MTDNDNAPIARFMSEAIGDADGTTARRALFYAVRDLPYATNAASGAADLLRLGRGNCLAKADLLARGFHILDHDARRVRWCYRLPPYPPEVAQLPSRDDIHTAVEVLLRGRWVLVDATHDPPLARGGLVVSDWDGEHATAPAYAPRGPIWREGADDAEIAAAVAALTAAYRAWAASGRPVASPSYGAAFNAWLGRLRAGA